jgi:threonine/homoserine/homoserine lactone efflux protein
MADGLLVCFLFGMTLAAAVGPIALLIINTGLSRGLSAALAAGLGAATADLLFALLAFTVGAMLLPSLQAYREELQWVSALVLVLLGLWMILSALRARGDALRAAAPARASGPFLSTLLLTMVNPLTIILFAGFATQQLGVGDSPQSPVFLAIALFLGSLTVQSALALGGAALARVITDNRARLWLNGLSGGAIAIFGIRGLLT